MGENQPAGGLIIMQLARRVRRLKPSPTLALDARAKELRAQGADIINLGVGEPDFDTPPDVKEAGIAAITGGFTRYVQAAGIPELRQAVCEKLKRDNSLEYDPSEIVICSGAKHAIYNALMALCEEGDEVLIPRPYWVSYPAMVELTDATPVLVDTSPYGFKLTREAFEAHVTPRTKALLLNSPNNPSGVVYTRRELEDIASVAVERGVVVISDEIYEKLVYEDGEHVSIASLGPEIKRLTVVINGVSKAYAMTGWRIGYAAAAGPLAKAMSALQSQSTTHAASISQKAAVRALGGPQDSVSSMVQKFEERRSYAFERLVALDGVELGRPMGAFYVFPRVESYIGKTIDGTRVDSSATLAELMLTRAGVAVVPGEAFGAPGYLRISYAASMEEIAGGIDRIEGLLSRAK